MEDDPSSMPSGLVFTDRLPPSDIDVEYAELKALKETNPGEFERYLAFNSELVELAERGDVGMLSRHIENRGSMRVLFWYLAKAVKSASLSFNVPTLRLLIGLQLELDHVVFKGLLPVLAASDYPSEESFVEVLEILLEGGMSIHDTEKDQFCTALHIAVMQDNLFIVTTLLQHEADANAINRRGLMPLNMASSPEVEAILKAHGAVLDWRADLPK